MTTDNDVVIEIPADEDGVVAVATEGEGKATEAAVVKTAEDEGVEDLKGQLKSLTEAQHAEKTRLEADAARERDRAEKATAENDKLRTQSFDDQSSAIENAIAAARAEADTAGRDYQTALESGDYAKATDAQRKISRAESKVVRLEEAKDDLDVRKTAAPVKTEDKPTQRAAVSGDPFENAIAGNTPRAQSWLRQHKEFVTDPKLNMKANAAHSMAVSEGYIPDSEAYFDYCEKFLGLKEADKMETKETKETKPAPQTRKSTAMPAAPVSRDVTGTNGGSSSSQITLTPGEQRVATDGTHVWAYTDEKKGAVKGEAIGLREFARRKAAMTKEGRYDRSQTDQ